MGTRSLTQLRMMPSGVSLCIFGQSDGYPTGHGRDLAKLLDKTIVNGFAHGMTTKTHANTVQCLFLQAIAGLKGDRLGGYYASSITSNQSLTWQDADNSGAEYVYEVEFDDAKDEVHLRMGQPKAENQTIRWSRWMTPTKAAALWTKPSKVP